MYFFQTYIWKKRRRINHRVFDVYPFVLFVRLAWHHRLLFKTENISSSMIISSLFLLFLLFESLVTCLERDKKTILFCFCCSSSWWYTSKWINIRYCFERSIRSSFSLDSRWCVVHFRFYYCKKITTSRFGICCLGYVWLRMMMIIIEKKTRRM